MGGVWGGWISGGEGERGRGRGGLGFEEGRGRTGKRGGSFFWDGGGLRSPLGSIFAFPKAFLFSSFPFFGLRGGGMLVKL